jgi:hypothetical protein
MATHRCNYCDQTYDTQKVQSGTVVLDSHAASDCPGCAGRQHQSRAMMPHALVIDDEYRAIPDPAVKHIPAVPLATEDYARMQDLVARLQQQLDDQARHQVEIDRSMQRLASLPLRPTVASAVVEPPAVGEPHLAEAVKTVEAAPAPHAP